MYGCHTGLFKTLTQTFENARLCGCASFQIFLGGNLTFKRKIVSENDISSIIGSDLYKNMRLFIHSPYVFSLINNFERTMPALKHELKLVSNFDNAGVIIHSGSFKTLNNYEDGVKVLTENLKKLFEDKDEKLGYLLLENTAGQGKLLPDKIETIARIIKDVNNPKLGFCLDTCHAFGSGIGDLRSPPDIDQLYDKINKLIGIEKLRCIHLNDSRFPYKSLRDGHALLATGLVWQKHLFALKYFLEKFKEVPMVCETADWDHDLGIIKKCVCEEYNEKDIENLLKSYSNKLKNNDIPNLNELIKSNKILAKIIKKYFSVQKIDLSAEFLQKNKLEDILKNTESLKFLSPYLEILNLIDFGKISITENQIKFPEIPSKLVEKPKKGKRKLSDENKPKKGRKKHKSDSD